MLKQCFKMEGVQSLLFTVRYHVNTIEYFRGDDHIIECIAIKMES
jgi:hypothetical protein